MRKSDPTSIFGGSLWGLGGLLGGLWETFDAWVERVSGLIFGVSWTDLGIKIELILVQNRRQIDQKTHQKFDAKKSTIETAGKGTDRICHL